jgi:site-specific recombinase XerD
MASVNVWINDKYKKKDGSCAVYASVYLHRRHVKFNTGVSVNPENWNNEKRRIKGGGKKAKDHNLIIDKCVARINEVFVRYRLQNKELTPELLRQEYKIPSTYIDFYDFYERKLNEQKGLLSENTIKQHRSVLKTLKEYKKQLMFSEITKQFLEGYIKFMKNKQKRSSNTIKKKMSILKGYLSIAVHDDVISENPFRYIQLKASQADRVYLDPDELDKLWKFYREKQFPDNYHKVLRHYLFSCFTGARISDVRTLTHDHVIGDKLVYKPVKQKSKLIKVPLIDAAKRLIRDEGEHRIRGHLFECYSEAVTNRMLKHIADYSGIPKKITFHSARHTFATMFLRKTKNLAALQKLLGHTNISDTMIYSRVLEEDIEADMKDFGSIFKL